MPININKYVDITSSLSGNPALNARSLIGRIFSINPLIPTNSSIEFTSSDDVGVYFGTTSEEYKRALLYFSFISKNGLSPRLLSYARWNNADTAPHIYGNQLTISVANLALITNGSFSLTLGSTTHTIGSLNFSTITSYANAATIIQSVINGFTGSGPEWTAATVTYNASRKSFDFVGGSTTLEELVSVGPGPAGTDVSVIIGWLPKSTNGSSGAIWSNGSLQKSITDTLINSSSGSNNFGSFVFTNSSALSQDQIVEASSWNHLQNVMYQFMVPVSNLAGATTYGDPSTGLLINYSGTGITLSPITTEYPEMLPMMILASTDYQNENAIQNYMFQQGPFTPSVTDTATSNSYDLVNTNYYGVTQESGTNLSFYQRGVLTGGSNAIVDMGAYSNEQWLKSYATALIMNLLIALPVVPANNNGRIQILAVLQSAIDLALTNGTISPGQILNTVQKNLITTLTGDAKAYYQVQSAGYWVNVKIVQSPSSPSVNYQAEYLLIYTKNNSVRKVEGTHILI